MDTTTKFFKFIREDGTLIDALFSFEDKRMIFQYHSDADKKNNRKSTNPEYQESLIKNCKHQRSIGNKIVGVRHHSKNALAIDALGLKLELDKPIEDFNAGRINAYTLIVNHVLVALGNNTTTLAIDFAKKIKIGKMFVEVGKKPAMVNDVNAAIIKFSTLTLSEYSKAHQLPSTFAERIAFNIVDQSESSNIEAFDLVLKAHKEANKPHMFELVKKWLGSKVVDFNDMKNGHEQFKYESIVRYQMYYASLYQDDKVPLDLFKVISKYV